jgi:cell fate regulator YaaT (PSP1 superfamily)
MPQTVEVRFKGIRRDFFQWPDEQDPLRVSEAVVVRCERGNDLGRVHTTGETAARKCGGACSGCEVGTAEKTPLVAEGDAALVEQPDPPATPAPTPSAAAPALRAILRRATPDDLRTADDLRRNEEEVRRQSAEKARQHKLDMKVTDAEWQWDRTKLTLYFTAEKRVDFRGLVRDLASQFRTRIELRQIGVRDEAARIGGVGRCGREYCCSTWLKELSPVSLALAKDQHLSLNPTQISGGCGRLLCCLKYEHEFYVEARKRFPREGKLIMAARGPEKVIAVDIFRERVFLRNEEGPRIVPLVTLREEMELAGVSSIPAPGPSPVPHPRRQDLPRPGDAQGAPAERRGGGRGRPEGRAGPPRPGFEQRPPPPRPAPSPLPEEAGEAPAKPADPSGARPRRRRRGRRGGRGGPNPPGASPPPGAPEA